MGQKRKKMTRGNAEERDRGRDRERKRRKKKRKLVTLNPVATKYVGTCTLYMKRAGSLCEAFDVTYHMTGCGGR